MEVPRVFISSTSFDLGEYREAARTICLRLNLLPDGMEVFEAMGAGARAGSLRKIDEADVMVGIYAHRYGCVDPADGRSVTEAEFDHAGDRGIERLCFLVDPTWPWPSESCDPPQDLRQTAFKERVTTNVICAWFTTVDDLRVKLMHALVAWAARSGRSGMADVKPGGVSRQPNLPASPALFIGREDDLAAVRIRLCATADGEARRTVIRGWPGVGKTTLVNALVHDAEVLRHFPCGVLWVALGQQPNPIGGLESWADALGAAPSPRQRSLGELMDQVRALLHGRKVLLVVDDVWDADAAVPFMQCGSDGAVLLTTRLTEVAWQLAATGDGVVQLGQLSEQASLQLFACLAPNVYEHYREECRALAVDLEGLPLAIRVAARLLETEAAFGWGVADLARGLAAGKLLLSRKAPDDRFDPVTGTIPTLSILLQQSTDRLDAHTRDRYAYLGAFAPKPATFDLEALQAVWDAPDSEDTKGTVRLLADRGLLEPLIGHGRFQMHAVLVMHARSLLSD